MEFKCLECSHDLALLFSLNKKNGKYKSEKVIVTCPDCDTKMRFNEDTQVLSLIPEKESKGLPVGPIVEHVYIGQETQQEMYDRLFQANQTACMLCDHKVGLYQSYLIEMETNIFPKIVEIIPTFSPALNPVEEIRTKYLPPVKEKGRICETCYKRIDGMVSFKVLPDPVNMIRDGARNVAHTVIPKFELPIRPEEPVETDLSLLPGIWDTPLIVGFNFDKKPDKIERRMNFTVATYDRRKSNREVAVERRSGQDRRKKLLLTVRCNPSRRVPHREDPTPDIKLNPTRERREAFKRSFR